MPQVFDAWWTRASYVSDIERIKYLREEILSPPTERYDFKSQSRIPISEDEQKSNLDDAKKLLADAERELDYKMQEAFNRRLNAADVPFRLVGKIETALQTPKEHGWSKKLELINSKIGSGFLYSIIGTYGTGKSQLGAALVHRACKITTAMFVHAPELFDTIKDVFRADDGSTVNKQLQKFISPKLLVIDEVNQGLTEADIRYLHRVICQRYDDMTDTLLISNETKDNYQRLVGDRVVSRMIECGGIIEANWQSFRGK